MNRVAIFACFITIFFIVNLSIAQNSKQSKNLFQLRTEKANYFLNKNKYYLKGTFHKYYTAYGSGNGILLKIELPTELFKQKYTIDSFFIENKYFPITILDIDNNKFAEVNIFYSNNPISTENIEILNENIFSNTNFEKVNSHIKITKKGVTDMLFISGYSKIEILNNH
ncbi:MAG: hypothetical protein ACOVJ8_00545 [Sediminibacterium sp.]